MKSLDLHIRTFSPRHIDAMVTQELLMLGALRGSTELLKWPTGKILGPCYAISTLSSICLGIWGSQTYPSPGVIEGLMVGDRFHHPQKPFRFEVMWIKDEHCEGVVHSAWDMCFAADPMSKVLRKVEDLLVNYYTSLFTTSSPIIFDAVLGGVKTRVTVAMNDELMRPFEAGEVQFALKQMDAETVSGSDGFLSLFYKQYWDKVGMKVSKAVLTALNLGTILANLNHTFLNVIPKVQSSQ
ncbi:hypothetical protein SO802_017346 [Lithocarpus litseifolius]|uniref:Uncharacterized protein n=1 Tax=Lithocarpus litseifolius TaxID=425828 RepID=A0AAW2D369_9ROSI